MSNKRHLKCIRSETRIRERAPEVSISEESQTLSILYIACLATVSGLSKVGASLFSRFKGNLVSKKARSRFWISIAQVDKEEQISSFWCEAASISLAMEFFRSRVASLSVVASRTASTEARAQERSLTVASSNLRRVRKS